MRTFNFDLKRPKPRPHIRVAFDLETYLIAPCVQAPPAVAMGFSVDGGRVHTVMANDPAFDRVVESLFLDESVRLFAHHARFDIAVLMAHGAKNGKAVEWSQMLLGAAHDDRVTCTLIRESLLRIAIANPMKANLKYDLGTCCDQWSTQTRPNKADPYRLVWGTFAGVHVTQLPADARNYLDEDVRAVDELYAAQGAKHDRWLVDQYQQTRASIALYLTQAWGIRTDRDAADRLYRETERELEEAAAVCKANGLMRENGTRDLKAATARLVSVFEARGEAAPRGNPTDKMRDAQGEECLGNVKIDEEACKKSRDPVLLAYTQASQATTLLAKVARLKKPVIQASYETLVASGRTSCRQGSDPKPGQAPAAHGSQMQNPPRKAGIRECFVARPGKALCSVDYDAFEMSSFAQVCLDIVGYSRLADILADPTRDPHVEMGAMILNLPPSEAYALKTSDPKRFKEMRQLAKACNFGYPGGLGAARFVDFAEGTYGVHVTETQAKELKKKWQTLYPETKEYFEHVSELVGGGRARLTQLRSGRVRGGVGYTDGCNSYFQGLAACAAKNALWQLTVEMYATPASPLFGSRILAFVHDEVIAELPLDNLDAAARRQAEVMVSAAKAFIPDVRVSASPAAMLRWTKAADAVYDTNGALVPWGPTKTA